MATRYVLRNGLFLFFFVLFLHIEWEYQNSGPLPPGPVYFLKYFWRKKQAFIEKSREREKLILQKQL